MEDEKKEETTEEIINEDEIGSAEVISKIKKLKEKLEICQKEKQEYLAGWQRAQADFINYKRRQENLMADWLTVSKEEIIRDILPVLDALDARNKQEEDEGLVSLKKQLMSIFKKHGLEEIGALGQKFNPEFHEATETVESEAGEGIIVEEVLKGYSLNGKIIRVAKVKVTKN